MRKERIRDYRHVSWDWNGTLLNDTWLCLECLNAVAAQGGYPPIDLTRYRAVYGFPVQSIYQALNMPTDPESFRASSIAYMDAYESRRRECHLHTGAKKILDQLHAAQIPQSIFSAYPQEFLESIVQEYQLQHFFAQLSGNDSIFTNSKAHRSEAHFSSLGVSFDDILYCGDTTHDAEVAQSLGIDCVLVASGHQARERLEPLGVTVVDDFAALARLL